MTSVLTNVAIPIIMGIKKALKNKTNMENFNINRRAFLHNSAAMVALSTLGWSGLDIVYNTKPYKVGLIGTGWYGKSDLFRLIQVAPIEVVGLCDVDKNLLAEAATLVSQRQKSGKVPPDFYRLPKASGGG